MDKKTQVYIIQGEDLYTTIKKAFLECLEQPNNFNAEPASKHHIELLTAYSGDVDPIPGILTPLILVQGFLLPMT